MSDLFAGLDLGQAADYTALIVAERHQEEDVNHYDVRHIQRYRLGTSYPAIVAAVSKLMETPPLSSETPLVVDGTGVGRAVVDMFTILPLTVVPVTITGGDTAYHTEGFWRVPKRDLVGQIQALLQSGRVKFAEGLPEVKTLVNELLAFQVKITDAGNDTYGAWREGSHDDLVFALSLCLWYAEHGGPPLPFAVAGDARDAFISDDFFQTQRERQWDINRGPSPWGLG